MIVLVTLLLVVVSVPLSGGRMSAIADVKVRGTWLIFAGFAIQTVVISIAPVALESVADEVHIASYLFAGAFLLANLRLPGVWIAGLGGGLNFAAILANGGTMPAGEWATRVAGMSTVEGEFANSSLVDEPRLLVLGDIFAIPERWPLANVFSIGDVLLVVGATVVLHRLTDSRVARRFATPRPDASDEHAATTDVTTGGHQP